MCGMCMSNNGCRKIAYGKSSVIIDINKDIDVDLDVDIDIDVDSDTDVADTETCILQVHEHQWA